MRKAGKHWDVLVLGLLALGVIVGVMAYDRGLIANAEPEGNAAALYTPKEQPQAGDPVAADEVEAPKLKTFEPQLNDPHLRQQTFPKPLEPGVVHLGNGAALGGKRPFPSDNAWNQTVDHLPVDALSAIYIDSIGREKSLFPAFGSALWEGAPVGIPYYIVSKDQPKVPIHYEAYGHESDPGPYPIPPDAQIEGHPGTEGDRHVIIVDRDNWKLYELFRAFKVADGQLWRAESGAIFSMATNDKRTEGWTSADAAGLPIFPGLVRYDEVMELKEIKHALRFTISKTRRAYVPPASHWASRSDNPRLPPLGMRVRLKASFDISSFPPEAQVILTCLKKYGMILADNGSDWYVTGAPDPRWDDDAIHSIKKVKGSDFEVIQMEGMVTE